jgi:hypothetical protein
VCRPTTTAPAFTVNLYVIYEVASSHNVKKAASLNWETALQKYNCIVKCRPMV